MYYSSYPSFGAATKVVSTGVTTVDCEKQVRSWRLFRSLLKLLTPTCNSTFSEHHHEINHKTCMQYHDYYPSKPIISNPTSTTITGTIFGQRKGKVNFCIQTNPESTTYILLLELAIPTTILAREMHGGLRIVLESTSNLRNSLDSNNSLLSMPIWKMYCNGKKVGFAEKRSPSKADIEILRRMESVVVGAGVISGKDVDRNDETMYLRGNFQWVRGSMDSDTFHFVDPDGNVGQELSIFFLRSR